MHVETRLKVVTEVGGVDQNQEQHCQTLMHCSCKLEGLWKADAYSEMPAQLYSYQIFDWYVAEMQGAAQGSKYGSVRKLP